MSAAEPKFVLSRALRHGWRALWRQPRATLGQLLLLGAALAVLAPVLALLETLAWRPLPFAQPQQLVSVHATVQRATGTERRALSLPDLADYRDRAADAFSDLSAFSAFQGTVLTHRGARSVASELIDRHYLPTLGVQPQLGQALDAGNDRSAVVLLSHQFWQRELAGASDVLNRTLRIDDRSYRILGVLPPGFGGARGGVELWLPLLAPELVSAETREGRGQRWLDAVGRLQPGVTLERAQSRLDSIGALLAQAYPDSNRDRSARVQSLRAELLGSQGAAVEAVLLGVLLLLAITLLNLGGLIWVQGTTRQLEFALHHTLGASRGEQRLVAAASGLLLGLLAAMVAGLSAVLLLPLLPQWLSLSVPAFVQFALHPGVALLVLGAGIGCGVLTQLGGHWLAHRQSDLGVLRAGTRHTAGQRRHRQWLVGTLLALGIALLSAALLLARSHAAVLRVEPGYAVTQRTLFAVSLPAMRYDGPASAAFVERLRAGLAAQPGVAAVGIGSDSPLDGNYSATYVSHPDAARAQTLRIYRHVVTPGYLSAAGIPLLHGEDFSSGLKSDDAAQVVVSADFARQLWGRADVVGEQLRYGPAESSGDLMRVIGVTGPLRWHGLPTAPTVDTDVFLAMPQLPRQSFTVLLHSALSPPELARRLEAELARLDGTVAWSSLDTMADRVDRQTAIPRLLAQLGLGFALAALLLSVIGIYVIAALEAAQRGRELAIRQAVGAPPRRLALAFIAEYGRGFVVAGAAGILLALMLGRLLATQLYEVSSGDPLAPAAATLAFAAALVGGLLLPLWRVWRVQPGQLLRD